MAARASAATQADYRELVITRVFDAPRDLVFKAWTDPEQLARWWGPRNFSTTSVALDSRPGGAHRTCMRSAEGKDYWSGGVFREVVEPERLAFTFTWDEFEDQPTHEMLVTVTFTAEGDRTRMVFRQTPFLRREDCESHREGWTECFDKLVVHLQLRRAA